jgi:hypothetical protein
VLLDRLLSDDYTIVSDGTGPAGPNPLSDTSRDRALLSDVQAIFPVAGVTVDHESSSSNTRQMSELL